MIQKWIEAMEKWCYRKMLKIPWINKVSSEEVLVLADEERTLMKAIRQRQLRFLGHTICEESIEKLAIEGKVEGKRARGRQRLTYMDGLTSVVVDNLRANDLLLAAQDRKRFQKWSPTLESNKALQEEEPLVVIFRRLTYKYCFRGSSCQWVCLTICILFLINMMVTNIV